MISYVDVSPQGLYLPDLMGWKRHSRGGE